MASDLTRTFPADFRTFSAKAHSMKPDETISILNERMSHWLQGHYRRDASKGLQSDFGIQQRTAEYALSGDISASLFRRILVGFGAPLSDFLFKPAHRTGADFLDIAHDTRLAVAATAVSLGNALGVDVSTGWSPHGGDIHPPTGAVSGADARLRNMRGDRLGDDGAGAAASGTRIGRAAQELMALRGAVDFNEEIGLDAVAAPQAILLDAWGASGGELSDSLIGAIDGAGLSGLASVFDNQMRVRRIGPAVGFWNTEQRLDAVGRDMGELPAPVPYLQAVRESLEAAAGQGIALHHRLSVRVGDVAKTYRRLALPCMRSGLVLSVSMLEAA